MGVQKSAELPQMSRLCREGVHWCLATLFHFLHLLPGNAPVASFLGSRPLVPGRRQTFVEALHFPPAISHLSISL